MKPTLLTYADAEAWLLSITDYERLLGSHRVKYNTQNFDLDHFRQQLAAIGDPHLRYAVVHVAGTKGKGSTCAFLESALRHSGFKTGLYTSPHLVRFTERIRVNGNEIPDGEFCRLLETIGGQLTSDQPADVRSFRTVFEILTATAFTWFAEQKVDVAIIETGLGGRLDSTNVFDRPGDGPLIDVISAIGLDHTAILGNTLEEISTEKAGIIRRHGRVVVASQLSEATDRIVREVVSNRCREIGAAAPVMVGDIIQMSATGETGRCWKYQVYKDGKEPGLKGLPLKAALMEGFGVCPALEGEHQARNVATALAVLAILEETVMHKLIPESVRDGIEHTCWPGRFQLVEAAVPVVIDGAHCVISAAALGRACKARFGDAPATVVVGFLKDKAGKDMLEALSEWVNIHDVIAVAPPTPRSVPVEHIADTLKAMHINSIKSAESVEQAISVGMMQARETNGYVIIYGSLYLVGPALTALGQSPIESPA